MQSSKLGPTGHAQERARELSTASLELLNRHTLVIASNRGPVEFQIDETGAITHRRGTGGVVTAISALSRYSDPIWIASAMTEGDRERARIAAERGETVISPEGSPFRLRFVTPEPEAYDGYYNRISNPLLWFLQHYLWDTPRTPDIDQHVWQAWTDGYVRVNEQFADEIIAVADASPRPPLILLQDYHLYLVAGLIRQRRPDLILQHFVHIPWPDPDYWQLLPRRMRQEICESMLANDIVGFQTPSHSRSFMNTCAANLAEAELDYRTGTIAYHGHATRVRDYPISIDTEAVRQTAATEDARRHAQRLADFRNEFTIMRVDRAEPSKNIVRGFLAYDRFLERYPAFLGRINFLAFLVPSRLEVAEYIDYLDDINTVVGRINTKYANVAERDGIAWQPIYLFIGDDYPRALAAMTQYDVLLVNAMYDGMNLVAKEGALLNERDGVIVLSEGAGAYQQLGAHAVTVSPTDIEGTAEAIYTALTMPKPDRAARAARLRDIVIEQDIFRWIYSQLEDLSALAKTP